MPKRESTFTNIYIVTASTSLIKFSFAFRICQVEKKENVNTNLSWECMVIQRNCQIEMQNIPKDNDYQ